MQKSKIGAVTDITFSMSLWHKEYNIYTYITSIEWIFSLWNKNYNKLCEIKVVGRNSTKIVFILSSIHAFTAGNFSITKYYQLLTEPLKSSCQFLSLWQNRDATFV